MEAYWKDDGSLKTALTDYVARNIRRREVLDYMHRDFGCYKWSLRTLDRRLQHFGIQYINYDTNVDDVKNAVEKELKGVGQNLGYRAMNTILRTKHGIKTPRHLVYSAMQDLDPDGLERRSVQKKKKKKKIAFQADGPLFVVSLDGHDKLCGYQNSTFPIAMYGCLDTFSRKMLFLLVCQSNSNPMVIGKCYFDFLYETRTLPKHIRIDKGTETGKMAAMQVALTDWLDLMDDPADSVIFGPSTTNKIERWWRDLNERLNPYFKEQLRMLLNDGEYEPHDPVHRQLLAYVYVPVVQRECNRFIEYWNTHRIRHQNNLRLPTGIPDHMYDFPDQYGGQVSGTKIEAPMLRRLAEESGILDVELGMTFSDDRIETICKNNLPDPESIDSGNAIECYRFLKGLI